ncbi:UNVERIFIED_ORG: hypothetical protein M2435_006527 [Rhizobium sophorae]|uniref:hypothetical protein n=1 Tax=Rhizobium leguminosarum TaxID=384 RepID=UPI001807E0BD|nr:hypothetical protein [Rhizobium leguminosarum]MBB4526457.1 hypothetical protein [Rhizobium leguminosarum]MDH6663581.1 hypothetical protein [Rhizobium sophorae]
MTAEQLKSELVGHPIQWKSKTQLGVTTYKPDGTIEATVDGDKATYKGTWSIKDNKMCEKFGKENVQRSIRLEVRNTPRGPEHLRWNGACFSFGHQAAYVPPGFSRNGKSA